MNKLLLLLLLVFSVYTSQKKIMPCRISKKERREVRSLEDLIRNLDNRIIRFNGNHVVIVRGAEDFLKSLKEVEDFYLKLASKCPKNYGEQLVLMRKIAESELNKDKKPLSNLCVII